MAMIDDYPTIKNFAFLPDKALDAYRALTKSADFSQYEVIELINKEYLEVVNEAEMPRMIFKQGTSLVTSLNNADTVYIKTSIHSEKNGSVVILLFKKNLKRPDLQPWEMQTAITENEYSNEYYINLGDNPKDMLRNYAYWPSKDEDLKNLKNNIALYENWSYVEEPEDDDFPILYNYFTYTFSRLWRNRQVCVGINGRYSVFNTGLVNRNYQYIYALFEKNIGTFSWKFNAFCIPGVQLGGRILAENFSVLPRPARYFTEISHISYLITDDKSPDEQLPDLQPDHYFIDHPDRLPIPFLLDGCRKNNDIISMLKLDISKYSKEQKKQYWKDIGNKIASDTDVYDDLESSFRNAVRKAVMRVSWNYRTAIPVYFPANDKTSILLPLSFRSDTSAEVALVVERNEVSKRYSAPTVLRLSTAYANARLVCKPESDWLNQREFESENNIETGEENE